MIKGRLRYWNAAKAFGFIERSDRREENLFIHIMALGGNDPWRSRRPLQNER